jgi:hypothetical protein
VQQSRNRLGVALRVPRGLGSQISMIFGTWRWWGCQPHAPAAFTPRKCSWYAFSLEAESTSVLWYGRKEYVSKKNPVTPPGIDTGTVRLVAQSLNHHVNPSPSFLCVQTQNKELSRNSERNYDVCFNSAA